MSSVEEGRLLPFAFARRHGLVVGELTEHQALIWCRPDANLSVLGALRARLDRPLRLEEIDAEAFETALNRLYSDEQHPSSLHSLLATIRKSTPDQLAGTGSRAWATVSCLGNARQV